MAGRRKMPKLDRIYLKCDRALCRRTVKPAYTCRVHGNFREYTDILGALKNWCLLWVTLAIIPITIAVHTLKINLSLTYLSFGITTNSAVLPIVLSLFWGRLTGSAMVSGAVGGSAIAVILWLALANVYPGQWVDNLTLNTPSLAGNLVALVAGGLITCVVTCLSKVVKTDDEVWEVTRDIDNPLSPWTELYQKDLNLTGAYKLGMRPSLGEVEETFRGANRAAIISSTFLTFVLVVLVPAAMLGANVLSMEGFNGWVWISKLWAFAATIFIIVVPLVSEVMQILRVSRENRVSPIEAGAFSTDSDGGGDHTVSAVDLQSVF
ncbi:uncharacterized protein LOC128236928 [Mya arenaria]|uniref:uncharacterized protein LOC128236928 n=1 Tax=Mya arenaria TaxID=6604 RepID=UPI0022E2036D|nr:uncharacterized protein LOC128236928 [Mya arenaria]